jgi:hypothetical protein
LVALATGVVFALGIILAEGGGSLARGWKPGWSYLSFYGILMIPILGIVGLVAMGLSRLIGGGIVMVFALVGLGGLLVHGAMTSTPRAQLARVTERDGVPDLEFEEFFVGHTFSDGTAYRWVARCSPEEAIRLINALGLRPVPPKVRVAGTVEIMVKHQVVRDYRKVFDSRIEGVDFYTDERGMIGGYSSNENRFRLYWWPAAFSNNKNG